MKAEKFKLNVFDSKLKIYMFDLKEKSETFDAMIKIENFRTNDVTTELIAHNDMRY